MNDYSLSYMSEEQRSTRQNLARAAQRVNSQHALNITTMNINFIRLILSMGLLWWCTTSAKAQDVHYTQFYHAPLVLNPAMTGHIEGTYRLNFMYRTQWAAVSTSGSIYNTPSASFDLNVGKQTARNSFGIGAVVLNDKTAGGLTNLTTLAGAAYHWGIESTETHYLSVGVQAGIIQKRIDFSKLIFGDQFDGDLFNPSQPTNEQFANTSVTNTDMRLGLVWSSYLDNMTIKGGAAFMHFLEPDETFDQLSTLPARLVLHGDVKFGLGGRLYAQPHFLYMTQAKASQINIGTHVGYVASRDFEVYTGLGMRAGDALLATLGGEFKGLKFGFSYDLNTSVLKLASNGVGAYEISLGYVGIINKAVDPVLPAVRFF